MTALRLALPVAWLLSAGCPDAQVARPAEPAPAAAAPPIAAWVACAGELGFEARSVRATAPGVAEVTLRPPALHGLSAAPADDEARALRWLTPIPSGLWDLTLSAAPDGALTLEAFAPGAFLDAQRLLVVARRCGPLAVGDGVTASYATGRAQEASTRGAARLVIAACGGGAGCPSGWRARLLDLAAIHADAAPPRFEDKCGAPAAPATVAGLSVARSLRAWVLDEVGPAPDEPVVDWVRELAARALGSGEAILRPRFDALRDAGDLLAAARLVDAATAADLGISERLRFDGALAWRDGGDPATARARLTALSGAGRTVYADFARRELERLAPR